MDGYWKKKTSKQGLQAPLYDAYNRVLLTDPPASKSFWGKLKLGSFLTAIGTIAGIAGGIYLALPRPVVLPPSSPLNANAFSVSFDVSNNSWIPLTDVTIGVGLGEINSKGFHLVGVQLPNSKEVDFQMDAWKHVQLNMDQRFTIVLSDMAKGEIMSADIVIVLTYKPWFVPLPRTSKYRFATYRDNGNGESHWRSLTLDAPSPLPPLSPMPSAVKKPGVP